MKPPVAEEFAAEANSSAALSYCPAMNRSKFGVEVPTRFVQSKIVIA
jgi:hypothetical protein